jgi:hypothetical protein
MIEISIGYLQDELKRLKPGDIESYKLITNYIRELQDEIDNVDPSSINWVTREIGRLEDEAAKLPAGAKEIQNIQGAVMNKKNIGLLSLILALAAIAFATYNSFSQLKDIDYDLFETDDEEDDD